jgi:hypothetical protein
MYISATVTILIVVPFITCRIKSSTFWNNFRRKFPAKEEVLELASLSAQNVPPPYTERESEREREEDEFEWHQIISLSQNCFFPDQGEKEKEMTSA